MLTKRYFHFHKDKFHMPVKNTLIYFDGNISNAMYLIYFAFQIFNS